MAWAQSQKELDDLKRLAQQRKEEAEARKQLNDAENSIAVAQDQNNVRADKLQLQRQAEHERSMAARQRFADSHAMTAVRDPGRFAPQAVKAARDYLENRGFGNRRYEFDQAQQTARHEASEKARGMIGQGSEAAQARAAGDRDVAEIGAASALEQKRLETAAQKELGALDAETKRYDADVRDRESKRRYGYFDQKTGEYVGGSDFNSADVAGEHQAKAEQQKAAANREMSLMAMQSRERIANQSDATKRQGLELKAAIKDADARSRVTQGILRGDFPGMTAADWQKMTREDQDEWLKAMAGSRGAPAAGAAGTGQGTAKSLPVVPGYSPQRVKALMDKGYHLDGNGWVK